MCPKYLLVGGAGVVGPDAAVKSSNTKSVRHFCTNSLLAVDTVVTVGGAESVKHLQRKLLSQFEFDLTNRFWLFTMWKKFHL